MILFAFGAFKMEKKNMTRIKIFSMSLISLMLIACGGGAPSYDSDSGAGYMDSKGSVPEAKPNEVEETMKEALAQEEENHKMRKEIFESKVKLGISTASDDD
jgi:hypothetical protein